MSNIEDNKKNNYIDSEEVDVSVCMMTYYHEKYIRQAIDSVLAQKTHYKYEIVISDDFSQDGTVDILKEYEAKYPGIVRVNYNDHNIGIPSNIYKARTMCRGRYITHLSGDDYWIDENKIEVETAFFDQHPEYSAVASKIELRMDDSMVAYDIVPSDKSIIGRAFTIKDYELGRNVGTHGMFEKNYYRTEEGREYFAQAKLISQYVDDAVDVVLFLRKGPIFIMDRTTDAQRVVKASSEKKNYNSRYDRLEKFSHNIELLNNMGKLWGDEIDFTHWYANYYSVGVLSMIYDRNWSGYKKVINTIPKKYWKCKLVAFKYGVRFVADRFKRN